MLRKGSRVKFIGETDENNHSAKWLEGGINTMKAKYRLLRTWDVRYEQVYCFDNIFLVVITHEGSWKQDDPAPRVEVCLTNAEARHMFFEYCNKLEKEGYECIYKEVAT